MDKADRFHLHLKEKKKDVTSGELTERAAEALSLTNPILERKGKEVCDRT